MLNRAVDWRAAIAFLYFAHNTGDATLFEGIKALSPGTVLTFQDGRLSLEKYWDINSIRIDEQMSYSDAIDGSIETFSRAIKRMLSGARGKQMVFLSMSIPPQHKMRSSLRKDTLVKNNWMFRNVHALPPAIRYYLSLSPSYMFSDSHVTFMEWLTEQFPRGRGL